MSTGGYSDTDPVLTAELVAVDRAGIDYEEYFACLAAGAGHAEILEAARREGIDLDAYCEARGAGASHKEALDFTKDMFLLRPYADARRAGASHEEICEVAELGGGLYAYVAARMDGISHAEVVAVLNSEMELLHYVNVREKGCCTHEEALEAGTWQYSLGDYREARDKGVTHGELRQAAAWGVWSPYLWVREQGASHADVEAVLADWATPGERDAAMSDYFVALVGSGGSGYPEAVRKRLG